MRSSVGRVRGLRDIRTLGRLSRPAYANGVLHLLEVCIGLRARGSGHQGRPGPAAPEAAAGARAWVFVRRPRFSRYQGRLLVDPVAEPAADVFEEGRALVVLAELPGIREEDIEVRVTGDVLTIDTRSGREDRRRYYREILLPFPAAPGSIRRALRNGMLEIELERDSAGEAASGPERGRT